MEWKSQRFIVTLGVLLPLALGGVTLRAQQPAAPGSTDARAAEIRELRAELQRITARLDALERGEAGPSALAGSVASPAAVGTTPRAATAAPVAASAAASTTAASPATPDLFHGTTFSLSLDGYYAYNVNAPSTRTNLLRAYDISSNSFSLNQAGLVIERLPQALPGQRFGGRLDLQFGQATQTLQGSTDNEPQPQVWRNVFQAYGSYLAPVGSGLQIDFGKWASALGPEGNYTKDQRNDSRSYLFDFLPFYHMGMRATYAVTPKITAAYWLVNGAQQTDDFNSFKSQALALTLKPATAVTWNLNYYTGQEQRANALTGVAPNGREHILDTYATWAITSKLSATGEADYVVNRVYPHAAPKHVTAGAAYLSYALPRNWAVATRAEYLSDRGGLYSGTTQALKETTFTLDHQFEPGFLARGEYRHDFSNHRFFPSDTPGVLERAQSTLTLGLIYWWGQKAGSW